MAQSKIEINKTHWKAVTDASTQEEVFISEGFYSWGNARIRVRQGTSETDDEVTKATIADEGSNLLGGQTRELIITDYESTDRVYLRLDDSASVDSVDVTINTRDA